MLAMALTTGWLHVAPDGPLGTAIEWTQPDGAKLSFRVFGDKFHSRTEPLDDDTVAFHPAKKSYEYAKPGTSTRRLQINPSAVSE